MCGCKMFDAPQINIDKETGKEFKIYGTLFIHRKKVEQEETSLVAIPIGEELKAIIDDSRDDIISPYIVHRLPDNTSNGVAEKNDHFSQLTSRYISTAFSKVRDELGLYNHLKMIERPTFHEIRALSGFLFKHIGVNPQQRMAHKDEKTTEIYTEGHLQWTKVKHAELDVISLLKEDIIDKTYLG